MWNVLASEWFRSLQVQSGKEVQKCMVVVGSTEWMANHELN